MRFIVSICILIIGCLFVQAAQVDQEPVAHVAQATYHARWQVNGLAFQSHAQSLPGSVVQPRHHNHDSFMAGRCSNPPGRPACKALITKSLVCPPAEQIRLLILFPMHHFW